MRLTRCLILIALCFGIFDFAAAQRPVTAVAVGLKSPDFTVKQMKYRVFANVTEVKKIPLLDYDFKNALSDELLSGLAEDTRMEWRALTETDAIDVFAIQKKKAQLPPLQADRVLLVGVEDFGALIFDLAPDKFYLQAKFQLIQRASGKKLWEKKLLVTEGLDGKLKELQADNQKTLKIGVNKVLERIVRKMTADLRLATI